MRYTATDLLKILAARGHIVSNDPVVTQVVTDSRKIYSGREAVFFALRGERYDGHKYLSEAYGKGVRLFVCENEVSLPEDAVLLLVDDTLQALQQLAAYHRSTFEIPVVGITGSNGKTIVKEWIYHFLKGEMYVCRSPKSYNSQVGVPLSLLTLEKEHDVALIEAGISEPGEMERLAAMVRPGIGVMTNLGAAHDSGFESREQKLEEKAGLFSTCKRVVYCADNAAIRNKLSALPAESESWSTTGDPSAKWKITVEGRRIHCLGPDAEWTMEIPFTDRASIENAINAAITSYLISGNAAQISALAPTLPAISMRLELLNGIHRCRLINDVYSADLDSLEIALHFMDRHFSGPAHQERHLIISDIDHGTIPPGDLYHRAISLIRESGITHFTGIGPEWIGFNKELAGVQTRFYPGTEEWLSSFSESDWNEAIVLLKGDRSFRMERITRQLQGKQHSTVLEINLNNMVHNLHVYRDMLGEQVGVMVMVKAFGYGSGAAEITQTLQANHVDYFAVAYVDEGIELRKNGIHTPVMVMNADPLMASELMQSNLEPAVYSLEQLMSLVQNGFKGSIHIKLDTGMNRLGFKEEDLESLLAILKTHNEVQVTGIFSHLSSADLFEEDGFSLEQIDTFDKWSAMLMQEIGKKVMRHLLNSPGIARFPQAQFDMVRLGIGLYGDDPSSKVQDRLLPVTELTTRVAQVKKVRAGESVSYGRTFKASGDLKVAILNIGYADGFRRSLSNGRGEVIIRGRRVPVIGRVCMDMCMADVSGIPDVSPGDRVEIFGKDITLRELAAKMDTIPYEVLTGISQRVRRLYTEE